MITVKPLSPLVWDNRCVRHRATPFDAVRYKRFMQRTTIGGDPAETLQIR
jgi:alpha-ketoglutarate-dependent taurine dioxygenase